MKKLGIAIKSTLMGSGEPFKYNTGGWESKIVDIRDVLRHVPSLASDPKRTIIFLTFGERGAYITVARTYPHRPGDNIAGWIYVPNDIEISGEDVTRAVENIRELIYRSELPDAGELERMFGTNYPVKADASSYKSSPKNGVFGKRSLSAVTPLPKLLGPAIYQPYYSDYQAIFIEQTPGEVENAEDLNGKTLAQWVVVLPPEEARTGAVELKFAANNQDFSRPVRVALGTTLSVKATRLGYAPMTFQVKAEKDGMRVELPKDAWRKKLTDNSFIIHSASGARITSGAQIYVNGQLIQGALYLTDRELRRAKVTVRYNGREKTVDADLTRLPLTVTLDGPGREAGGGHTGSTPDGGQRRHGLEPQPEDPTWSVELRNGYMGTVSVKSSRHVDRNESPLRGYEANGGRLEYKAGNVWLNRAIGFCAAVLLGGVVCGILAICGVFSHKPDKAPEADVPEYTNTAGENNPGDTKEPETPGLEMPAKKEANPAEAGAYLDGHTVWVREEMEAIPGMEGLYDALATFDFSGLVGDYNAIYIASEKLKNLKVHADEGQKYWDPRQGDNTGVNGNQINYQIYINNLDPGKSKVTRAPKDGAKTEVGKKSEKKREPRKSEPKVENNKSSTEGRSRL